MDTSRPPYSTPGGAASLGPHEVSRIGYGAMQLARFANDRNAAVGVVRAVVESGVTHIDTAAFYGGGVVNDILRSAGRLLDDVVIATKIGAVHEVDAPRLRAAQRPEELARSVELELTSLGRDRLDLVNLRRLDRGPAILADEDQIVPLEAQLEALLELREAGLIDAIGLSGVSLDSLRTALPAGIACVQNSYGLLQRDDEPLLELSARSGVAWVPFFPLGGGFSGSAKIADDPTVQSWAHRLDVTPAQLGLAWLLDHSPSTLLIPGTTSLAHLRENLAVGGIELPDEARAELDRV